MTQKSSFLLIMPSYNQAGYITTAVDSVLAQDDPDWDLWIIDNSSDDTPDVMRQYTDPRIHFRHIPERMDPGACLNMVLAEQGEHHRDFSYIHTDNTIRSDYVRRLREALATDARSLAYCDMRCLDGHGRLTGVFRRGAFDLARLFSFATLGVPFGATTLLARELGGFSRLDVADDVVFCIRAWPVARFSHIPDALMDYRLHDGSRTESHGGAHEMQKSFLLTFLKLCPEMQGKNADPIQTLADRLTQLRIDIELSAQDTWYREGSLTDITLQAATLDVMMAQDMFDLPDHPSKPVLKAEKDSSKRNRFSQALARRALKIRTKLFASKKSSQPPQPPTHKISRLAVWNQAMNFRNHAIPWLFIAASSQGAPSRPMRLASHDVYTLWITFALHDMCGWRFIAAEGCSFDTALWTHLDCSSVRRPDELLVSISQDNTWVKG
jgi:Glycosyl transferase family 2